MNTVMNKTVKIVAVLALAWTCLGGGSANAADRDNYQNLVASWTSQRDKLVRQVVVAWLRGAEADALRGDLQQIVSLDVRLATDPSVPLYVTGFREPDDIRACLRDLVATYMRRMGLECDSTDFFRGKTFQISREDGHALAPKNNAKAIGLMKWAKQ
jgi:hypothetical protein